MFVVPHSSLAQLLPWLKQALPKSFKIYGDLRSVIDGKWPGTEFVVDKWPSPQAVLVREDVSAKWELRGYLGNSILGMYGDTDGALQCLLTTPGVIDWDRHLRRSKNNIEQTSHPSDNNLQFSCVQNSFWPMLRKIVEEEGGKCLPENDDLMLKAGPEDIKLLPVPDGMKLIKVTENMVDIVNSTWKFADEGSNLFIAALIRNFPSLALVKETGQHVGHMLGQNYGAMGMLYIMPEFRGQGLGKVLVTNLAQVYFEQGDDAYVFIEASNEQSLRLHQSVGFKIVPDMLVAWISCVPNDSQTTNPRAKCCV